MPQAFRRRSHGQLGVRDEGLNGEGVLGDGGPRGRLGEGGGGGQREAEQEGVAEVHELLIA